MAPAARLPSVGAMEQAYEISGRWRGFYEQDGRRHGISMEVAQRGSGFVGQMRDEDTVLSSGTEVPAVDGAGDAGSAVAVEQMSGVERKANVFVKGRGIKAASAPTACSQKKGCARPCDCKTDE